jgi:DNA-binding Lrp family transcriptional regulator
MDLVNAWQRDFPLAPRPFAEIAARCGSDEASVLRCFENLKANGTIDRIGPVFRPNTVGASCLAAMAVPPEQLEQVAALVSGYRGVNHNYEREHRYNLWFVVTGRSETPAAGEWQKSWDVHVMAHVHAASAVLPHMLARG